MSTLDSDNYPGWEEDEDFTDGVEFAITDFGVRMDVGGRPYLLMSDDEFVELSLGMRKFEETVKDATNG